MDSAQRPGSIRSVASNSSIGSCLSLSRRPRTKTRSRTVTGSSSRSEDLPQSPTESILPYLSGLVVQDPPEEPSTVVQAPITTLPIHLPSSPEQREVVEIRSSDTASSLEPPAADATVVEPSQSPNTDKQSKAIKVASGLRHLDTGYRPPPSAFSRDPALTPIGNVRDSVSTQQSGTSSSLYPPSTSTASGLGSPTSPLSMADRIDQLILPPVVPEVNDVQEYDSDDVSYRLRLLVKNNYFLPPAHSKPSPEDFASASPTTARKASTPFLDLFRGKSKSKPSTPPRLSPAFDPGVPMLRTTSDSIVTPYASRTQQPRTQQPRSSSQMPRLSPRLPCTSPRGRVVVVREKMNDIAVAAKQAEQDLKTRGVRMDQGSQKAKQELIDDVIDPTDAVDIPLLSPSYPFAVQASASHGLGVLDSVGAAALADRLPPSKNPNMSTSFDTAEDSWRKALLHEAVHHSLDNTPDISSFSHILGASTPLGSPRSKRTDLPSRVDTPSNTAKMIQQKIVAQPHMDIQEARPTKHVRKKSAQSQASTSKDQNGSFLSPTSTQTSGRPASYFPERVDTPSGPMTPLCPPPRRYFVNTVHSLSQSDLINHPSSETRDRSMSQGSSYNALRRTVSSPLLAEGYESLPIRQAVPHRPAVTQHPRDSQATTISFNTIRESYDHLSGIVSDSHQSDVESGARASLALSAVRGRPSLSEYSQSSMSPTTSMFQEILNRDDFSGSSLNAGASRFSLEQQNAIRAGSPRYSAMSPPPRMSSSLAHIALPPPPRSSSHYFADGQPQVPLVSVSRPNQPQFDSEESALQILAPEPTTPPLPLSHSDRGSGRSHAPPSLTISTTSTPIAIHSAPGPSSSTSFFDTIQAQPNAMDDLESSSDEDEDEADHGGHRVMDPRNRTFSSVLPAQRPPIMRLGNFSTPYLRKGESYRQNLLPIGNNPHSKQPRSSSAFRQPFFVDRKHDVLSSSTYDFFKYAQEHPPTVASLPTSPESSDPRRPSTADHVTVWRNNQRAQESLRKLDGMLIQHMEDEKDTIKRIATTLKQTSPTEPSNPII